MGPKEWHKSELPKISLLLTYSRLGTREVHHSKTPKSTEKKKKRNKQKSLFSTAKKTKKQAA